MEPGFELDEACAPVIVVKAYVDFTNDYSILDREKIKDGLNRVVALIESKKHSKIDLYETFLQPTDDMIVYPYLTYNNVLVWRVFDIMAEFARYWGEDGEPYRAAAERIRDVIMCKCVVEMDGRDMPCPTVTGKYKNEINTSNLGIIYGGLASINRYLKREDIILATREIREYVFGHNISGGMLVSNNNKELSPDIILAAVPFGMFSPEDLVLVEAVSEIEKKPVEDDISFLILSWYYAEKGEYAKARLFLKKYNVNDRDDAVGKTIKSLVLKTLEDAGESQGKVIHRPYGNGNRYVCGNCVRIPNDPKEGDTVIIRATAWPDYPDNFVLLHYSINGGSETTVSGRNMNSSKGYWEWEIGPFKRFDRVDCHFSAEDGTMCTEDYGFTVWGGENAVSIRDIARVGEGCIKVTAEDSKGKICPDIYILPQNGCFKISFNKQTDCVAEAFSSISFGRNRCGRL